MNMTFIQRAFILASLSFHRQVSIRSGWFVVSKHAAFLCAGIEIAAWYFQRVSLELEMPSNAVNTFHPKLSERQDVCDALRRCRPHDASTFIQHVF